MEKKSREVPQRQYHELTSAEIARFFESWTLRKYRHTTGTHPHMKITYENYPYLLIEEIHNRKGLKGKFAET